MAGGDWEDAGHCGASSGAAVAAAVDADGSVAAVGAAPAPPTRSSITCTTTESAENLRTRALSHGPMRWLFLFGAIKWRIWFWRTE